MSDLIRQAKDRGVELMAKGNVKAALAQFEQVLARDPDEVSSRQKTAECLVRLGRGVEAAGHYAKVSEAYARAGQFFKAIAACKIVLSLDPKDQRAQDTLASLYASTRGPGTRRVAMTATPLQVAAFKPPEVVAPVVEEPVVLIDLGDEVPPEPPKEEPGSTLPAIPLFGELTPDEFKAVLRGAVEARAFDDGEAIVTEGQPGTTMYAIVEGEVGVVRPHGEVARMKEGDIFGEIALVSGGPRLASIVARGPVLALEFQRTAMVRVFATHPGVKVALERFLRERLLANVLRANPVFRPLSAPARALLLEQFAPYPVPAGQVVVAQGQVGEALFMVLRGGCEVEDESGAKYPALHEGDLFGELSLVLQTPATATVRTTEETMLLRLPGVTFLQLLHEPAVKAAVVAMAKERLARTRELRDTLDVRI
jgi:CRP-like cAMP-binding protein